MATASTQGRKGSDRGQRTRAAILAAAQQHFAERGFRGASLASIAKTAGISEPGLLHHFSSKADLLVAVLYERDVEDERLFQLVLDRDVSIIEAGAALVADNQRAPESVRLYSMLLGESLEEDHPAHEYFANRYRTGRVLLGEQLRTELGERARHDLDPELLCAALMALMDGLQFQWQLDRSIDMVACYEIVARIILDSLRPGEGAPAHDPSPDGTDRDP